MPAYIHSDRGSAFMSAEFKRYLLDKGIASSRTTSYNPAGNGQVERLNQTLWQTIKLGLKTHKLPLQHWQELLSDALQLLTNEFLTFSVGLHLAPRYCLGLQPPDQF